MSRLKNYFENNDQRVIYKWDHYFEIYEQYFERFVGMSPVILEIGVYHGGSLQMWKHYFGSGAKVFGIDINPNCQKVEEDGIEVFIGSQSDRTFLEQIKSRIPRIDILIDDGGHSMSQQIISFKELFTNLSDNAIYLCEDIHSSYLLEYGGGFRRRGSFIEFSKGLIDSIHAHHSEQRGFIKDKFTESIRSIHFYENVLVVEKGIRQNPRAYKTGKIEIESESQSGLRPSTVQKIKRFAYLTFNKVLRAFRLTQFD